MTETWRWYPIISAPMPFQMALDEILFRKMIVEAPSDPAAGLRFYFSSEPWVSLGFATPLPNNVTVPICRRITGGGQVLHGQDLIFSLYALKKHDESFLSVHKSYHKIHEALQKAFVRLGKGVDFFYNEAAQVSKSVECFRSPIATDLHMAHQKIAGGAQKRSAGALLHQESVQIPKGMEIDVLKRSILQGFRDVFSVRFEPIDLNPKILSEAHELAKTKYDRITVERESDAGLHQIDSVFADKTDLTVHSGSKRVVIL